MSEIKYEIIKKIGVLSKSALALSAVEGSGVGEGCIIRAEVNP